MRERILRGPENISTEMAVRYHANIFNRLDFKSINYGFKRTGLSLFKSEPTMETLLSREEQILNLYERFDKFACSDPENDQ